MTQSQKVWCPVCGWPPVSVMDRIPLYGHHATALLRQDKDRRSSGRRSVAAGSTFPQPAAPQHFAKVALSPSFEESSRPGASNLVEQPTKEVPPGTRTL